MKKNQENHPVDELFSRRLRDLEGTPTPRAWNTLEKRLAEKKDGKRGVWMAVAASVAVLAGCFVAAVFYLGNAPGQQPDVAVVANPKTKAPTPQPTAKLETSQPAQPKAATPTAPKKVETTEPQRIEQPLAGEQPKPKQRLPETAPAPEQAPAPLPTEYRSLTALAEKTPEVPTNPEVTVVVVKLPETPQAEPETEETSEEPAQPAKTKVGKFWQAIKKAKQSEINIDKDALFAWVKEKNTKSEK